MTRINVGVNVKHLMDEHLLAEHREIKRICDVFKKRYDTGKMNNLPTKFTLGTGHVLFFIDKPIYTFFRYMNIYLECKRRNFNVEYYSENWNVYFGTIYSHKNYLPTLEDKRLVIERISERLINTPKSSWHYYGAKTSKEDALIILNRE